MASFAILATLTLVVTLLAKVPASAAPVQTMASGQQQRTESTGLNNTQNSSGSYTRTTDEEDSSPPQEWIHKLKNERTAPSSGQQHSTETGNTQKSSVLYRRSSDKQNSSPSQEQIHELRHESSNFRNMLFAYSEMLDILQDSEESRRKRADTDNQCNDIQALLLTTSVSTTAVCPYTYTCSYDPFRYPRYIISVSCSSRVPNDGTKRRCLGYGHTQLSVLEQQESTGWTLNRNAETVYHGCEPSI